MKNNEIKEWLDKHFYNPFKPNIFYSNEYGYVIRKFTIYGWEHLDRDFGSRYWWMGTEYRNKYCTFKSYDSAVQKLEWYHTSIEDNKFVRVTKEQK